MTRNRLPSAALFLSVAGFTLAGACLILWLLSDWISIQSRIDLFFSPLAWIVLFLIWAVASYPSYWLRRSDSYLSAFANFGLLLLILALPTGASLFEGVLAGSLGCAMALIILGIAPFPRANEYLWGPRERHHSYMTHGRWSYTADWDDRWFDFLKKTLWWGAVGMFMGSAYVGAQRQEFFLEPIKPLIGLLFATFVFGIGWFALVVVWAFFWAFFLLLSSAANDDWFDLKYEVLRGLLIGCVSLFYLYYFKSGNPFLGMATAVFPVLLSIFLRDEYLCCRLPRKRPFFGIDNILRIDLYPCDIIFVLVAASGAAIVGDDPSFLSRYHGLRHGTDSLFVIGIVLSLWLAICAAAALCCLLVPAWWEQRRQARESLCTADYHRAGLAPGIPWLVFWTGRLLIVHAPYDHYRNLADCLICPCCGNKSFFLAPTMAGTIGAVPPIDSAKEFAVSLFDPATRRTRSADIDRLEIYPPAPDQAIDYDYAINAVLNALTDDHHRTRQLKRIPVHIHGKLKLPDNARRILGDRFGRVIE